MSDDALVPDLERIKADLAAEATRAISRAWYQEALLISEATMDPEKRWHLLVTALRRIGWPEVSGIGRGVQ